MKTVIQPNIVVIVMVIKIEKIYENNKIYCCYNIIFTMSVLVIMVPISEGILMPYKIAKIFRKHIKNNPNMSFAIDGDRDISYNYKDLKIKIIADHEIINAYKLLSKHIEISACNVCERILMNICDILQNENHINYDDYNKKEKKIVKLVENKARYLSDSTSILDENDYEYILMHQDIITQVMKK